MSSSQNRSRGDSLAPLGHKSPATMDTGPGGSQGFCLKLNSHPAHVTQSFRKLYSQEVLCDCTISAIGGTVKAHKLVLSSCSSYFMSIFSSITNPFQYPVIVIKDMPLYDLKMILEFMYKGEVTVQRANLASVLASARALEVTGLADIKIATNDEVDHHQSESNNGQGGNQNLLESIGPPGGKSVTGSAKIITEGGPRKLSGFNLISNRNKQQSKHHHHHHPQEEDDEEEEEEKERKIKKRLTSGPSASSDADELKFNSASDSEKSDEEKFCRNKKLKCNPSSDGPDVVALNTPSTDVQGKCDTLSPNSATCDLAQQGQYFCQGQRANKIFKNTGPMDKELEDTNLCQNMHSSPQPPPPPPLSSSPSSSSSSSSSSVTERVADTLSKCPSLKTPHGTRDINLAPLEDEVTCTTSTIKIVTSNDPSTSSTSASSSPSPLPSSSSTVSYSSSSASLGQGKNRKLWSEDEINLLLDLWLEEIKRCWASGGRRVFSVKNLAHLVNCQGLTRDVSQIEGKMKAIKRDYKSILTGRALSNVQIRIAPHLEQLKEISKFEEG